MTARRRRDDHGDEHVVASRGLRIVSPGRRWPLGERPAGDDRRDRERGGVRARLEAPGHTSASVPTPASSETTGPATPAPVSQPW